MKPHFVLLFVSLVSFAGCDMQEENPLSSPAEYLEQGVQYFDEGSYRQAKVSFEKATSLLDRNSEFINRAELYGYLGRTNLKLGEYRASLDNLETAIQVSAQLNDYRFEAQVSAWKADVYSQIRKSIDATDYYRRSMRLSSALNDVSTRAQTEMRMAGTLVASGNIDQASTYYNEALAVFQNDGTRRDIAEALCGIAEIYRRQGRYPEALNTVAQALESLGSSENPLLQARLKMVLGLTHRAQSNANALLP